MKKIIVFALLLIISVTSFSQETNSSIPVTKADYMQKSKNQKTTAWVLLGGGTVLISTGILIGSGKEASFDELGTGVIIGGIGFLSVLSSIPLFIVAGNNKRKAMSLSFKNETLLQLQNNSFVKRPVPSLSLKISL